MSKRQPKPAWSSFTKAELIRTIKKLDKRQTQLLNEVVLLKAKLGPCNQTPWPRMPWETESVTK